jgi:hypothetical protein
VAVTASQATSDALRRIRDPGGIANDRTFVRDLISRCQVAVNSMIHSIMGVATLTTMAQKQFYRFSADVPTIVAPHFIRDTDDRDLYPSSLAELNATSPSWHRRLATRHEAFAMIGNDLLILHPAKEVDSTVTVIGPAVTTALTTEATTFEVHEHDVATVLDLAELMLLLRARRYDTLKPLITKFASRVKERSRGEG